jgi:DNA-binding NarL/FixJ family response regulator
MSPTRPSPSGATVSLSTREKQIIALAAQGLKNREMAEALFISAHTVKTHMRRIFEKLGVSDRLTLVLWAIRNRPDLEAGQASPFHANASARSDFAATYN